MALNRQRPAMWLCLQFPLLGLESCSGYQRDRPTALLRKDTVLALNQCAIARGLQTGISVSTLQVLAPDVVLREWEAATEQQALQQLALWAWQYTPGIALYPQQLLLEIGSCLQLFKGAPKLLQSIRADLEKQHYTVRYGLGNTPLCARALVTEFETCTQWLQNDNELAIDKLEAALDALAVEQLLADSAFSTNIAKRLRSAGISHTGQLRRLPAAAVGRRFGKSFKDHLARLFGQQPDPQTGFEPAAVFELHRHCLEPVKNKALLLAAMSELLTPLDHYMHRLQLKTRKLSWQLCRHGGGYQVVDIELSAAGNCMRRVKSLLELQLENLQIKGEIISIRLECKEFSHCDYSAGVLFRELDNSSGPGLDELLERLTPNSKTLYRIAPADNHIPELAQQSLRPQQTATSDNDIALRNTGDRPFWLLRAPAPLHQQGQRLHWRGPLELLGKPERIAGNWWQLPLHRDYFVARGKSGELYWVFRDNRQQRWFLQGFF